MGERLTEIFMLLFCEKNSNGTKNLVLNGKDLYQRINKRISDYDMLKIAKFLKQHPEVIDVNLCYNNIGDLGFDLFIYNYLYEDNNLQSLNLMGCDITHKSITNLCSIPRFTLRSLRVNNNRIGVEGGKQLAKLLQRTNTILHLDVGQTGQTLESLAYFTKTLNYNYNIWHSLQAIDLSRINQSCIGYPFDTAHLAESVGFMLQFNASLKEIHLQKCELMGHDIELMLIGLKRNSTLLFLDVGYNRIGNFGAEVLAEYLKSRPVLTGMNVAGNGIADLGAKALSYGLPFSRIRLLDISQNKITADGILDILYTIKKPYMLRLLYMWGNTFSHESNKIIKRMLEAQVLEQEHIDVKIYEVDKVFYAAYYPADRYKHKYYCVLDYACPVELKIKRNYIPPEPVPRRKLDFKYHPQIPLLGKHKS